jgi:hypothetical protein
MASFPLKDITPLFVKLATFKIVAVALEWAITYTCPFAKLPVKVKVLEKVPPPFVAFLIEYAAKSTVTPVKFAISIALLFEEPSIY